jgi:hypothetical protein
MALGGHAHVDDALVTTPCVAQAVCGGQIDTGMGTVVVLIGVAHSALGGQCHVELAVLGG